MINLYTKEGKNKNVHVYLFYKLTISQSLPLIQEGQLSVSGERMCTILVNRLED